MWFELDQRPQNICGISNKDACDMFETKGCVKAYSDDIATGEVAGVFFCLLFCKCTEAHWLLPT